APNYPRRSTPLDAPSNHSTDLSRSASDEARRSELRAPLARARSRLPAACAAGLKPPEYAPTSAKAVPPPTPTDRDQHQRSDKRKPAACDTRADRRAPPLRNG